MKERPILFSAPMVRAILDGRKTQTRRVVKLPKSGDFDGVRVADGAFLWSRSHQPTGTNEIKSPYGVPGDRLWVREAFATFRDDGHRIKPCTPSEAGSVVFPSGHQMLRADRELKSAAIRGYKIKWKPSIHMPRWASRITLEVTGVRVERLQDISPTDALAEGIVEQVGGVDVPGYGLSGCDPKDLLNDPRGSFRSLWESINGADSWVANPRVWVVEFKRVAP